MARTPVSKPQPKAAPKKIAQKAAMKRVKTLSSTEQDMSDPKRKPKSGAEQITRVRSGTGRQSMPVGTLDGHINVGVTKATRTGLHKLKALYGLNSQAEVVARMVRTCLKLAK
ncbi:hypothetical protein [Noviherbaspirillum malthae]|uniref:hypothetical protein n=1 Tax=Noviherbaspirillum malthae TaxID=1260987 RepID=UPI00188F89C9|nr:hypothetical protein [Noviherbaspirillum malthae]